jgi:antitoxin PrlF
MATTVTSKGQVTIPKRIRDALKLSPGSSVEFAVNADGEVVVRKAGQERGRRADRFESVRGSAQVKWKTAELMALLRG